MNLSTSTRIIPEAAPTTDWSLGWRYETVRTPDGKQTQVRIPLTPDEALHPQEGHIMPVRNVLDTITDDLCDMLRAHYAEKPAMTIYHDLVFQWDHPDVRAYAPDVAVVPNVRDPQAERGEFVVAAEETRPRLIIEVVSPSSREGDRVQKFNDYALVGVQEYVYIDHWTRKGQTVWEITGFRLQGDRYLPMLPDEDGALYCETVGLRIGIEEGKVWLEDANTGEDLLTNLKAHQALRETAVRLQAAEERAAAAEAELAHMKALLEQQTGKLG